ncbi:MAG TPA: TfoX/Sxy family protein [Solirubrobacteraceae bacterium]|nr:TfoX/Sxy family protein [Solirubrobacteraceae bacterium]
MAIVHLRGRNNPLVAYDEDLADRIRVLLATDHDVVEKKMFGGLAFLIGGNMSVSASGQGGILLRCDPAETAVLVHEQHVERFVMRGKAMDGWLRIDPDGVQTDDELRRWVAIGVDYARGLPPKS